MIVSLTDIQNNFVKYLEMASSQEILIAKNGTATARLLSVNEHGKSLTEQLRGIIPANVDEKAAKEERVSRL